MLLTQNKTFIIGPIAILLGYIMNVIFLGQEAIGISNIGLCIIMFTIVIYLILTPLTIKQQKFSKLQSKMQPELSAIQKKYKGKKDQVSMMKMQEETQNVYAKYGVSPMGSCVQLLIQMPILFALYRVIWNIPAYVTSVKEAFMPLADKLFEMANGSESLVTFMTEAAKSNAVSFDVSDKLTFIDTLYKFKPDNWTELAKQFPDLGKTIASTQSSVDHMNNFLGLNIADSPMQIITSAFAAGAILLAIGAALIPILAAVTQWLNAKLMTASSKKNGTQASTGNESLESTMKTMNMLMPIMSLVFCLTLPVGMGIYWIAGAVVRSVQQIMINRKIDKIDINELIKQNLTKANKKRERRGLPPQKISDTAKMTTKNIEVKETSAEEKAAQIKKSTDYYKSTSNAKAGSLAAKAQMVKQFNERTSKK